jgi:hypothetical protein
MKIEIGKVKSKIITDNPAILKGLRKIYSFRVDGAEFTAAYKNGWWDGKKEFIRKDGTFRTGLLQRLLNDLKKTGVKLELEDPDNLHNIDAGLPVPTIDSFEYREYQRKAISNALRVKRGVIKFPTGSGKTLIMPGS